MSLLTIRDTQLWVHDTGGPGPLLFLSHGLLWNHKMWTPQLAALAATHRCIAWDHRGQGQSVVPPETTITIEANTLDAIALIEHFAQGPVHFAGLSMGGMVGMRVAIRRPDLLRSLILLETSADAESRVAAWRYRLMARAAELLGVRPLSSQVMPILFGKTWRGDPSRAAERDRWRTELEQNRNQIGRAVRGVCARDSVLDQLCQIRCPTLVMVGDEDVATPPFRSDRIVAEIPGAELVRIPLAGHTSTIEAPAFVNQQMLRFLGQPAPAAEGPPATSPT